MHVGQSAPAKLEAKPVPRERTQVNVRRRDNQSNATALDD